MLCLLKATVITAVWQNCNECHHDSAGRSSYLLVQKWQCFHLNWTGTMLDKNTHNQCLKFTRRASTVTARVRAQAYSEYPGPGVQRQRLWSGVHLGELGPWSWYIWPNKYEFFARKYNISLQPMLKCQYAFLKFFRRISIHNKWSK